MSVVCHWPLFTRRNELRSDRGIFFHAFHPRISCLSPEGYKRTLFVFVASADSVRSSRLPNRHGSGRAFLLIKSFHSRCILFRRKRSKRRFFFDTRSTIIERKRQTSCSCEAFDQSDKNDQFIIFIRCFLDAKQSIFQVKQKLV